MSLKSQMAQDAAQCFLNASEFAESITYTPKSGAAKVILAIVNRKRIDPAYEDSGRVLINQCEIFVANGVTAGVTLITKGADNVSLPETIGGPVIDWVVADILGQDEGLWHLLLQK